MKSKCKYLVYGLVDPITKQVRYVGRSSNGLKRPRSHSYPKALRQRTYLSAWVRKLKRNKLMYDIVILETFDCQDKLNESEKHWISYFKDHGTKLTNLTDGGMGCSGYKRTQEDRDNKSKALKLFHRNHGMTKEWKSRISSSCIGRPSPNRRKIMCINDGKIFKSFTAAAEFYGMTHSSISLAVKHDRETKGLKFKVLED